MPATGEPNDSYPEYSRLGESTNLECLKEFAMKLRMKFESEWLRLPNESELLTLSNEFTAVGFPGFIGGGRRILFLGYMSSSLARAVQGKR